LPCALFVLGASLSAYKISGHFAEAWTMVGLKLLLQPLLVWVLAFVVFKIDPLWGAVAVMMAGMPVGINVYMFAQKYQVGLASVSGAIVISTTLAVLSQSILLAIFI
jgi:predicted permease